jgi:hypothetical protein
VVCNDAGGSSGSLPAAETHKTIFLIMLPRLILGEHSRRNEWIVLKIAGASLTSLGTARPSGRRSVTIESDLGLGAVPVTDFDSLTRHATDNLVTRTSPN